MDGREGTIHGLKIYRGSCLHYRDSFDVVEDIIEPDVRHENQRVSRFTSSSVVVRRRPSLCSSTAIMIIILILIIIWLLLQLRSSNSQVLQPTRPPSLRVSESPGPWLLLWVWPGSGSCSGHPALRLKLSERDNKYLKAGESF
ncbi:hypothetical protein C8034_v011920 [Colletotrichum sidae]|uniref:Uncharacterized protein n=1 Tax=Colletotrichum sidae TaxID=1347389 RepID=A0A4R8TJU8_9PEZI|nr:hypothetical protein C8034_v011920 [Colletotrichum sidae]